MKLTLKDVTIEHIPVDKYGFDTVVRYKGLFSLTTRKVIEDEKLLMQLMEDFQAEKRACVT